LEKQIYNESVMFPLKNLRLLTILISVFLSITARQAFAQNMIDENYGAPSDETIQQLKSQSIFLLEENRILEKEYEKLSKELFDLQVQAGQHENELQKVSTAAQELLHSRQKKQNTVQSLQKKSDSFETEKLLLESRRDYLRTQLMDMEENERLWALKLADSEYELRQLELSVRLKDFESDEYERKTPEIEDKLQESLLQEKELQTQIADAQGETMSTPLKIQKINDDNAEFEIQLQELERRRNLLEREFTLAQQKKVLEEKKTGRADIENEKRILENSVRDLEEEHSQLSKQVKESLVAKRQSKELIKDIIAIDKENHRLRQKIVDLQNKTISLNE
jgi:chromosome segregation ATPase